MSEATNEGGPGARFTIEHQSPDYFTIRDHETLDGAAVNHWTSEARAALAALLAGATATMTGREWHEAVEAGKTVEFVHSQTGWRQAHPSLARWAWSHSAVTFVARVVEPESDPDREWMCERGHRRAVCLHMGHASVGLLCGWKDDLVQIAGPPAPVSDLPEGVHESKDGGLWLLPGYDLPADEWDWFDEDTDAWVPSIGGVVWGHICAPVRPVRPASPVTEQVPLHELAGRTLPGKSWPVHSFGFDPVDGWVAQGWPTDDDLNPVAPFTVHPAEADASGCVTVLAEDGK